MSILDRVTRHVAPNRSAPRVCVAASALPPAHGVAAQSRGAVRTKYAQAAGRSLSRNLAQHESAPHAGARADAPAREPSRVGTTASAVTHARQSLRGPATTERSASDRAPTLTLVRPPSPPSPPHVALDLPRMPGETLRESVLRAALSLPRWFAVEDLVVAAYTRDPERFALAGYPHLLDAARVYVVATKCASRGLIERSYDDGQRRMRVTASGREAALERWRR